MAGAIDVLQGFTICALRLFPVDALRRPGHRDHSQCCQRGLHHCGRFGRGVILVRDPNGAWRAPLFVTFTGGSVGWQLGLQSTDVVLVFKNRKGLETMLSGSEFTLGADASVAAGPVGRQATAGTDIKLNAEIYSYSRSRGLFAGVALDGSVLKVDNRAVAAYYVNGTLCRRRRSSLSNWSPATRPVVRRPRPWCQRLISCRTRTDGGGYRTTAARACRIVAPARSVGR